MQDQDKDKGVLSSILTELGVITPDRQSTDSVAVDQKEIASDYPSDSVTGKDPSTYPSDGSSPTQGRRW
ncbi:hypothetical protein [Rhizobium wenxiniae]|uniref:hypothetical protein n=1 Tax=Rhizobium wenxiniae TaxID=1737357 RepID=UPI003C19A9AC